MDETEAYEFLVAEHQDGMRLDVFLAEQLPEYSRSHLQNSIRQGLATRNGLPARPKDKVLWQDHVAIAVEPREELEWLAEDLPLTVVYEDSQVIVVDKAAGMVTHPGAGNYQGTLVNALLHHFPELKSLPRAGVVHRLDKDTTGLLVVARTEQSRQSLIGQLQDRSMGREYEALVIGVPTGGGTVEAAIGRDPRNRLKMAVVASGKEARTDYAVVQSWTGISHLRLRLFSGRTHQIRVHMSHIHYPLIGDTLYNRGQLPRVSDPRVRERVRQFPRQALHAASLGLWHPESGDFCEWDSPLPEDLVELIDALDESENRHGDQHA